MGQSRATTDLFTPWGSRFSKEVRKEKQQLRAGRRRATEGLAACLPGWLSQTGCCRPSACLSLCPTVAMPTPGLCLWMLYLISQVWNSNYVISQHKVAMTASPMSLGGSHLGRKKRGPKRSPSPAHFYSGPPGGMRKGELLGPSQI